MLVLKLQTFAFVTSDISRVCVALTLKRPPGVKCDPTKKMAITNAGVWFFYCQIKIDVY